MADIRLIKKPEVLAKCAISHASLYRLMKETQFPAPLQLSTRAVAWIESEVDEWILSRPRKSSLDSE